MIEQELNENSSEDEIYEGVPSEYQALSHKIASDMGSVSNFGLLSQYVKTKMAR